MVWWSEWITDRRAEMPPFERRGFGRVPAMIIASRDDRGRQLISVRFPPAVSDARRVASPGCLTSLPIGSFRGRCPGARSPPVAGSVSEI